jgi:hypothetical protein
MTRSDQDGESMANKKSFYEYFQESMRSVGLDAPHTVFGAQGTAVATISAIAGAIAKFGTRVTIAELIGAGVLTEKLMVVGTLSACYYLGACIGALAYATGQWSSENLWASNSGRQASPAELLSFASRHGIKIPQKAVLVGTFSRNLSRHIG